MLSGGPFESSWDSNEEKSRIKDIDGGDMRKAVSESGERPSKDEEKDVEGSEADEVVPEKVCIDQLSIGKRILRAGLTSSTTRKRSG